MMGRAVLGGLGYLVVCLVATVAAGEEDSLLRLMTAERDRELRALFPRVNDPFLQKLLADPRLLLYTEAEMPRCYQDSDGALRGVHLAAYNISADPEEPFGNGNLEFPWNAPGGTHRAAGVTAIRFLWLPVDEQGRTRPVTWYRKRFERDREPGYGWIFPAGAVLGELLLLPAPAGDRLPFELRLRYRRPTLWEVDVFRPFPRAWDLAARIEQLWPAWWQDPQLAALMAHLQLNAPLPVEQLVSAHAEETAFQQQMGMDSLPPVDNAIVRELLTSGPFVSALGKQWREDLSGNRTVAPTTVADFHIVPAHYDGGFIDVDSESCMRCHEGVNRHVRDFEYRRDWYGRVRGSDGIFSFHPFAGESISPDGIPRTVTLRQELIDAGWLEHYDIERHPRSHYRRVLELDE